MNKKELRLYITECFKKTTKEQRKLWSYEFCKNILHDEKIMNAKVIMAFYPLECELDISMLLDTFTTTGKLIILPVVVNDTDLQLRVYKNKNFMIKGNYGILIPQGDEYTKYDEIDVVLVPGMAFDEHGHRLGRGKGYYDRFLKKIHNAYTIAVYFPFQKVANVPVDSYDVIIDYV